MHKCLFVDFSFICRSSRWNMRTLPIIRLVLVILCIYIYTNFVLAYAIGKRRTWEDISNNNLRNRLRIYIWLASYIWKEESTKLKSAKDSWIEIVFFLFIFQRRISREGVLNEAGGSMGSEVTAIDLDESMHQLSRGTGNDGSSDPLLQIPTQLSAVLTMKRGSPQHRRSQSKQINTTPLLKRKRESIVWSWEKKELKILYTNLSYGREK